MNTTSTTPIAKTGIRKALDDYGQRLSKHQIAAGALELQPSVSTLVKCGLTVLLLLAVSGIAAYLPGTGLALFRGITIALLLKLGIAVAIGWLLLTVYRPAVCVLSHFAREVFRLSSESTADAAAVAKLAWNVTLLIEVCLVYWIFMRAFTPILSALTTRKWPFAVMDIGCLAIAIVAMIGIYVATSPLFGKVGDAVAQRMGPVPAELPQVKCPQCGVLTPPESRYCSFCGSALPRTTKNTDGIAVET